MNSELTGHVELRRGRIWIILGAVLWGTTGTLQALAPRGISPLVIGEVRITLGALFLLAFVLRVEGARSMRGGWPLWSTLVASVAMAAYQFCFFAAVLRTGVAVGTMVTIGSSPVMAGLMGKFLLDERLTRRWWMATVMAVGGCSLLSMSGGRIEGDGGGVFLALGAGLAYALVGLGIKRIQRTRSSASAIAVIMFLAALMASPVYILNDLSGLRTVRGVEIALALGLFSCALAYGLFSLGLMTVPVSTAYTLSLVEPLTACLLGVLLLGERLSPPETGGVMLLFSGILLLAISVGRVERKE